VTAVTRELIDQGLVRVAEHSQPRRGRPALLLELVGDAASAFGAKVAVDHVVGVRIDLEAEVIERFEEQFDAAAPDAVVKLGELLRRWLSSSPSSTPLLGVGLGVSGVVDVATGTLDSPLLGWRNVPVAHLLQEDLGLPVYVDNDVNTLAVSERLYGRGRDAEHFFTVTIGRGVGLGIVAGGDIYRGFRGGAGEFGHTTALGSDVQCSCGKRGCLETVVADPALVAHGRRAGLLGRSDGIEELRALADRGDTKAKVIFAAAGEALGRAVGDLVNILGPELVFVSGEGTQAWLHIAEQFETSFAAALFGPLRGTRVEVDPWDDARWAVGAATLVLRASFAAPFEEEARAFDVPIGVIA